MLDWKHFLAAEAASCLTGGFAWHGIYSRGEKPTNAGGRNTFRQTAIEDDGGCGIYVEGHTTDLLFEDCTIRDTRSGAARTQRVGVWAGPISAQVRVVGGTIENHVEGEVQGSVARE